MKIKVLSVEETLSTTVASSVSNATVVRLIHSGTNGTHHLVTIKNATGNTIGTVTLGADQPEYFEKSSTDTLLVDSGTDVMAVHVAFR
jgi:hypothetical protein